MSSCLQHLESCLLTLTLIRWSLREEFYMLQHPEQVQNALLLCKTLVLDNIMCHSVTYIKYHKSLSYDVV